MEEARLVSPAVIDLVIPSRGAVAQLGARLDGIEEVVGSNPIGSTNFFVSTTYNKLQGALRGTKPLSQPAPCAPPCRALRVCLHPWPSRRRSSWCECRCGAWVPAALSSELRFHPRVSGRCA